MLREKHRRRVLDSIRNFLLIDAPVLLDWGSQERRITVWWVGADEH